jgi:hypothetical protein
MSLKQTADDKAYQEYILYVTDELLSIYKGYPVYYSRVLHRVRHETLRYTFPVHIIDEECKKDKCNCRNLACKTHGEENIEEFIGFCPYQCELLKEQFRRIVLNISERVVSPF